MASVTVLGAHGSTLTVPLSSTQNLLLAQQMATTISEAVTAGVVVPATDAHPALPPGESGEFILTQSGLAIMPSGYRDVVNLAAKAIIFGSGDDGENILSGISNLNFIATAGSGNLVAGGGSNNILISGNGDWNLSTNSGNDIIAMLGGGAGSISAGTGNNVIALGSGQYTVNSTGNDSITAGSGAETIGATGAAKDFIVGGSSNLLFINGEAASTVLGGAGSDTIFSGAGGGVYKGGAAGNNFLAAGAGNATLESGGNNDTLFGATSFGNVDFVASTGNTTIVAGFGQDTFTFNAGNAGGTDLIQGFLQGFDKIDLEGYAKNAVKTVVASQTLAGGTDTLHLSDGTQIILADLGTKLTSSDFG